MGYVYGIQNQINNKWYVGQSIYHPKERWRQEIANYPQHNMVISKAIQKYGVENFIFILLEENIKEKNLDEREIFWIAEKDSYYHGYNSTKGGKSHIGYRIPYEMEEIVEFYVTHPKMSCRDVGKHFNIFHETVSSILKEYNIPIRNGKNPITLKRGNEEYHFNTYKDAGQFLIDNGYATQKIDQLRKNILPKKDKINDFEIIKG